MFTFTAVHLLAHSVILWVFIRHPSPGEAAGILGPTFAALMVWGWGCAASCGPENTAFSNTFYKRAHVPQATFLNSLKSSGC